MIEIDGVKINVYVVVSFIQNISRLAFVCGDLRSQLSS